VQVLAKVSRDLRRTECNMFIVPVVMIAVAEVWAQFFVLVVQSAAVLDARGGFGGGLQGRRALEEVPPVLHPYLRQGKRAARLSHRNRSLTRPRTLWDVPSFSSLQGLTSAGQGQCLTGQGGRALTVLIARQERSAGGLRMKGKQETP
jgi:hypothetical protein